MSFFEKYFVPAGGVALLIAVICAVFFFVLPQYTAYAPVVPNEQGTEEEDVSAKDIALYFVSNNSMSQNCSEVVKVSRRVPNTLAIAHTALTELLRGVDAAESETLTTLIPSSAALRSIGIEDGVATVTFVKDSFLGVAGSCRVIGIRSQIEATLKQFSSVSSVIILEEGKPAEETLQP